VNTTALTAPCPRPTSDLPLRALPIAFEAIPRATWDRLLAATASPTPFSRWTFHRAWWDAYGATAEPRYLACCRPASDDIVAIVPLMTRVVTSDAIGTPVPGVTSTLFMAASYHADYATILCDPADLPAVADSFVCTLLDDPADAWSSVDLRRLRQRDPVVDELTAAFRRAPARWRVSVSQEDVCPVVTLPPSGDWEAYLAGLDKKARHEIRRKLRRAEAVGPVRFRRLPLGSAGVDAFIELHQARWGDHGLFPATPDGDRSRRFLHRLTALEAAEGSAAQLLLGEVCVGDRVLVSIVAFDDGVTCFFYNAGMDPMARELSPGVTGTAAFLRDMMAAGRSRFDFLRGNEPYKYEWGARDEPVERIVVTRA
jgi:CelD/BcsL family acetyltransferase involved in cellulose biosynthesis